MYQSTAQWIFYREPVRMFQDIYIQTTLYYKPYLTEKMRMQLGKHFSEHKFCMSARMELLTFMPYPRTLRSAL